MTRDHAAAVSACRLFLRAAIDPHLGLDERALLELRDDIDWTRFGAYLCGSGLARPLLGLVHDPALARAAPEHVRSALAERGVFDVVRERVQRDAVAQIGDALRELGGRGVLLKGSAFLVRTIAPAVSRGTSDIDIVVDPAIAARLRSLLVARGFEGDRDAAPTASHHLAPIEYRGVAIEIHTRIMPAFWGLPEREMLADVRPVSGSDALFTFSPRGLVLHSLVHISASFFAFGIKTAWDLLSVLRAEPSFDWPTLLPWVSALRVPRAFWAPLRALTDGLQLPVPSAFLDCAPADPGARRIEHIARQRLFESAEGLFDLDVVTKTALTLQLLDNWPDRAGYLGAAVRWRGSRPRTWRAAVKRAQRADVLRQAWQQYRRDRRH